MPASEVVVEGGEEVREHVGGQLHLHVAHARLAIAGSSLATGVGGKLVALVTTAMAATLRGMVADKDGLRDNERPRSTHS
jgi:hypothetical protein